MRQGFLRRLRPLSAARPLWGPLFLIQEAWSKAGCSGHCGGPTLLAGSPTPLPLVGLLGIPHSCAFSGELFSADKSWMALRPWLMTGGQGVTHKASPFASSLLWCQSCPSACRGIKLRGVVRLRPHSCQLFFDVDHF